MARIGIDARLWTKTGVGRYIRNLIRSLASQEGSGKHQFFIFALSEDSSSIKGLPANFKTVPADYYWHSVGEQFGFNALLNSYDLNLMHFTYSPAPYLYNRPYVITVHDLIMIKMKTGRASTLPYPIYFLKGKIYKKLLTKSVRSSGHILVPTKTVKDELKSEFDVDSKKVTVTYEGFDPLLHSKDKSSLPGNLISRKYFLYVGNAYPHKNIETLISGFIKFEEEHAGYNLVLVGKKDFFYTRLQRESNLLKNTAIQYLSEVNDTVLSSLFSNAAAYVTASKSEGFGLPVLESLSHLTPVIVSDIPVFHEIAPYGSVFFNESDSMELAMKMDYVIKHSDVIRKEIKDNQKHLVENFSWDVLAQQTLAVYESCIGL